MLGFGQFDDFQCDAVHGGGISSPCAGIALSDIDDVDMIAGDSLDGAGEPLDLARILRTGWRYMKREQMAQRVDRHVDLRALLALAAVIIGALATFGR